MNRDDHLNNIAKHFGRLTHEIRALNAIGRFDINSVAEDFLIPVLKVAFTCPDLRNQNEILMNFPAVDLGCRTTRISFQVTTDASSGKVEKTLKKFHEHDLDKLFNCVYILALTEKQSAYKAGALACSIADLTIPFNPTEHIIDVTDLLSQTRRLDTSDLERIDAYLASGWAERDRNVRFREQLDKFLKFSTNKIELEKRSRKYIPSIFVETHSTKEEVRLFANPLFFYRKIQDNLLRLDYSHLNSRMRIAREPEFVLDLDQALLTETPSTFAELKDWLDRVGEAVARELAKVRPLSWRRDEGEEPYQPVNGNTPEWEIVRFPAESVASGLTSRLQDALGLIGLIRKKIFLVTSMAGQGKTNFVCDLVENQFRSFAIPCLFIPARELNSYTPGKRLFEYISNNRYSPDVTKIHEYLDLFNNVALATNKPFLIVIDGINEVADLNAFSDELKAFCNAACQYDWVKVIITCRSEFFDEKYASILDEPFAAHIHRINDLRLKMTERSKNRLLTSYFSYFSIKGQFSKLAKNFLKSDLLLLRIFCERYEGSNVGYVADIYKGDLFEQYLLKKIKSFPQHLQVKALPTLYRIVTEMLDTDDFAKLSVRSFTAEEQKVVRRFVEDDVILRQEIGAEGLSTLGDLAISFTYDELRDFVIAYKLVLGDATGDTRALKAALVTLPGRPIYEGVYRYVYLLARKSNYAAAIAACESSSDFVEHFSLNVHLLPPSVQTRDDVERVKALLADSSAPERLRRAAGFLVHRQDTTEALNISILRDHLNGLETADHAKFVGAMFARRYDYERNEWQQRLHGLIHDVAEAEEKLARYDPEWLAFFLHVSSLANWSERERVSTMFRKAMDATNCRDAVEMVRPARTETMRVLLADIESVEDVGQ
ncbi:hypothetical protein GCM10007276_14420 [Agaricicola taiwanensis]|uniref:SMEK domain-containing protein n=1 Tax=Agaricicola taiwanensis TaxID=591372 RepID=A0A8J2VT73_9RHOB|nr:SMEK domain-containing protein [Agaricicola taiwanensis]GGE38122.1 hypothetical protein GCM10007276_14420 [Agaricicola taiwanensis]